MPSGPDWTSSVSTWATGSPATRVAPDYFTHWGGSAFKYAASLLGLPIGDYPHSRPPQTELPESGKTQIEKAYLRLGLIER